MDLQEFYRKCFLANESLTNQIEWAQAEAVQSRERVLIQARMEGSEDEARGSTFEEDALATLFEAHSQLGEVLKQHDDLERMARDENEMREVRERSKKETRMNWTVSLPQIKAGGLLLIVVQSVIDGHGLLQPATGASSSRSPSPAPLSRLPAPDTMPHSSPHLQDSTPLPIPPLRLPDGRSRTPSPDRLPVKISSSPGRASPLGGGRARGPRPLPNPFAPRSDTHSALSGSLPKDDHAMSQSHHSGSQQARSSNPSRSGTGSTHDGSGVHHRDELDDGSAEGKPSYKAMGKRRAAPKDPDSECSIFHNPLFPCLLRQALVSKLTCHLRRPFQPR